MQFILQNKDIFFWLLEIIERFKQSSKTTQRLKQVGSIHSCEKNWFSEKKTLELNEKKSIVGLKE